MEDFRTEGNEIGNLDNMHQLCVPKGKQFDHFIEGTVHFLRDSPAEPFCYRPMLQPRYNLQKVYLGTEFPEEKLERKRKAVESRLERSSSNPIMLEETENPIPKQQDMVKANTSTQVKSKQHPEKKRGRLEEIIHLAKNKNKPSMDAGFPERHF